MKITKTKLKRLIREELKGLAEIDVLPSGRAADTRGGPHMSAEKFVDSVLGFFDRVLEGQASHDEIIELIRTVHRPAALQAKANPTGEDF